MQELIKLWKEYDTSQADKNGESSQNGPTLEIQIPAEHVTATNRQVRPKRYFFPSFEDFVLLLVQFAKAENFS